MEEWSYSRSTFEMMSSNSASNVGGGGISTIMQLKNRQQNVSLSVEDVSAVYKLVHRHGVKCKIRYLSPK